MTREEFITKISERIKTEYNDAITYAELSNVANSLDLDGAEQLLDDIAYEEYRHAERLEYILRNLNAIKEDNFGLKKNAHDIIFR